MWPKAPTQSQKITLISILLLSAISWSPALSDDIDFAVIERAVCGEESRVAQAACRAHRESVFTVGSLVFGYYKQLEKMGADTPPFPDQIDKTRFLEEMSRLTDAVAGKIQVEPVLALYRRALALTVMNYVQTQVSSTSSGYASLMGTASAQPLSPETALLEGRGICGNQVETFRAILTKLQIPTRSVQFWWRDAKLGSVNHIAAEVAINGRWEFFDVTWGATFPIPGDGGRLMTIQEARAASTAPEVNPHNLQYRLSIAAGDNPFAYRDPAVDMTIENEGPVTLHFIRKDEKILIADLENIPTFIGDNSPDSTNSDGTHYFAAEPAGQYDVAIEISAVAGCEKGDALTLGGQEMPLKEGRLTFPGITLPTFIKVKHESDICYAVISGLQLTGDK